MFLKGLHCAVVKVNETKELRIAMLSTDHKEETKEIIDSVEATKESKFKHYRYADLGERWKTRKPNPYRVKNGSHCVSRAKR